MPELLSWSLDLGTWRGVRVRIHLLFLVFAALNPLFAALAPEPRFLRALTIEGLLLLCLAIHEVGHAIASVRVGSDPEDVLLGPLGNLVLPPRCFLPQESIWIPLGGVIASGLAAIVAAIALGSNGALMIFSPFGNFEDSGAPILLTPTGREFAKPLTSLWILGWFGWINWVLCLVNLIPALPMDGGRAVRAWAARSMLGARDSLIVPITARACAVLLGLIGVVRLLQLRVDNFLTLILLAVLIELLVRVESRGYEEGGEHEAGIFGYDFSQGYTSLESSAAKVRPARESALARWRRRRSDHRRRRRQAQAAAEERRLDEILDKLHREGKTSLSEEENRFLTRVSSKLRGRKGE
ncbi:MAG: hypothetical protein SFX72_09480 [Isosphaeraceae bacterium]|nr:hypothetical protein [Isosphaeraceae bacterium]